MILHGEGALVATDPPPQMRYFTLIDLIWELFHVTVIATGAYVGWILGHHFLTLLLGAYLGRVVGVTLFLWLHSILGVKNHR